MAIGSEPLDIFVSYRRSDSAGHAGRLQDALNRHFGRDHVFYDVTDIEGGIDFAAAISDAIDRADVVAVIIGPRWGRRRLRDRLLPRQDWVLFEIGQARRAGKPVLPIFVGGGSMPASLPAEARFLSTINAFSLRDESWENDVERLIARLPAVARTTVQPAPPLPIPRASRRLIVAGALVIAAGVIGTALVISSWPASVPDPGRDQTASSPPTSTVPSATQAPSTSPLPPAARDNKPPSTGSIEVDQFNGVGLVAATRFTLKAKDISDPDGDALRYRWDFGDGSAPPPSSPQVTKVYDRVNRFQVRLYVTDGKMPDEVLAAETYITVRDITGTWHLTLRRDPSAAYEVPTSYEVMLTQQGNQLSGRITPTDTNKPTVLTGSVEHPTRVQFGSEHAWWNDDEDAYFDLYVSDGALMIQMMNSRANRCGPQIPCLSALMNKR
jgi:hypothetical protein